jgi:hypothetical protein
MHHLAPPGTPPGENKGIGNFPHPEVEQVIDLTILLYILFTS